MTESRWSFAFRALRHRNYRLFFAGQSLSLVGTWMTQVATSWLVYRLTNSALLLGLVGFSGAIPAQSVRTKQPKPLAIEGFYRLLVCYGRPDQPINILNSLDPCLDNTHSSSH